MNTLRRLRCALFRRHKYKLEAEYEIGDSKYVLLFRCERCGEQSWSITWTGIIGRVAIWDRALTAEEIRFLADIPEGKNDQEENTNQ